MFFVDDNGAVNVMWVARCLMSRGPGAEPGPGSTAKETLRRQHEHDYEQRLLPRSTNTAGHHPMEHVVEAAVVRDFH